MDLPEFGAPIVPPGLHVGHMSFLHRPDEPWRRQGLAMQAASRIYSLMPDRCGCAKALSWTIVSQDFVPQFANTGDEPDRCVSAANMIRVRFGDYVWYP